MASARIGIIGGVGGIGRWFAAFFEQAGYTVHVSGQTSGLRPAEMAAACPVVIVSGLAVAVVLLLLGTFARMLRKVGPNQALIRYGLGGTQVVQGGAAGPQRRSLGRSTSSSA